MAQLDAAADSLMVFCAKLRPLFDVADALKGLGSVENAIKERAEGLVTATAAHEDMLAKVEAAQNDLANIAQTKASEMSAHVASIKALSDKADDYVLAVVASAKADAAVLVSNAEARVRSIEDNHATVMAAANIELSDIKRSLVTAHGALDAIHAEHDAVSAKITALKAAAASVLA